MREGDPGTDELRPAEISSILIERDDESWSLGRFEAISIDMTHGFTLFGAVQGGGSVDFNFNPDEALALLKLLDANRDRLQLGVIRSREKNETVNPDDPAVVLHHDTGPQPIPTNRSAPDHPRI